jgi:cytochrome c553
MKNTYFLILLTTAALLLTGAQNHDLPKSKKAGSALTAEKCFPCHGKTPEEGKRQAPPMPKVHAHYKAKYATEESFVAAIKAWVKKPGEENALMHGAIKNFGVMPELKVTDDELQLIAEYLYKKGNKNPGKSKNKSTQKCCDKCAH